MARPTATGVLSSNRASIARMLALLDGIGPKAIDRADRLAMSGVARRIEPVTKRVIRDTYNVRASELAGQFRVRRSRQPGALEQLELHASIAGVPLVAFGGRWRGPARRRSGAWAPSATAEILRGDRKSYPSAFTATINGTQRIYVRQYSNDSNSPSGRSPRNKLRALRGPSVFQMTQGLGEVNARAITEAMNLFRGTEILRQLNLARRAKG